MFKSEVIASNYLFPLASGRDDTECQKGKQLLQPDPQNLR